MATAPKQTAKKAASAPETPLSATSANVANTLPDYATGAGALKLESAADLQAQIDAMRAFFKTGATQEVNFRLQQLTRLKSWLKLHEAKVLDALEKDLGKCPYEGYMCELGLVYDEINMMKKHLRKWARRIRFPRHSRISQQLPRSTPCLSAWQRCFSLELPHQLEPRSLRRCSSGGQLHSSEAFAQCLCDR